MRLNFEQMQILRGHFERTAGATLIAVSERDEKSGPHFEFAIQLPDKSVRFVAVSIWQIADVAAETLNGKARKNAER